MRTFAIVPSAAAAWLLMLTAAVAAVPDGTDELTSLAAVKPPTARIIGDPTIHSQLKLTNRSKLAIEGPLGVVVHVLKPEGVTLTQATGTLAGGDGYVELLAQGDVLQPNESTRLFTLLFDNPLKKRVKYRLTPYGVLPGPADPPVDGQANVTGMVKISLPRPRYNPKTQTYRTKLRLTNVSDRGIDAPVTLALPTLGPDGASLVGGAGELADGTPFIQVPLVNDSLPAGKKSPVLTLDFAAPARSRIRLVPAVYGTLAAVSGSDPLFGAANAWNQRVDSAPLRSDSAAMISQLKAAGGWGAEDTMRDRKSVV